MTNEQHEIERRRAWIEFIRMWDPNKQKCSGVQLADILLAAYDARFPAPVEREADTDTLNDKIDALSSELDNALDVIAALCNGKPLTSAAELLRLNYPRHRATLSLATPTEPDWRDHTPGDPMPVPRGTKVDIKMKCGRTLYGVTLKPDAWEADLVDPGSQIIQWKPAQ